MRGTPLAPHPPPFFFYLFAFLPKREKRDNGATFNDVGIKGGNPFNWKHRETLIGFWGFGGRFCFAILNRLVLFLLDGTPRCSVFRNRCCKGSALLNWDRFRVL
ncbi:hypothetical protein CDAR_422011 [Caerostris darwini]|uniref:Secreted protein n=1 Tax=Caerostris darwini TaxID=1538125 RepID=A0AAV4PJI0_9ARAC|nr:hypothetical protein CDAR_422011 [Caerostris darwini]